MNSGGRARGDTPSLTVGIYDEPELIVLGVEAMLARSDHAVDVVVVADSEQLPVDVLLCDPVGRTVAIEDYLGTVTGLTEAPVLVFTWSSSPGSVRRSLDAGARGVLWKGVGRADLVTAVQVVASGDVVAPERTRPRLLDGVARLSIREAEVLDLICRGMSNLEIADHLYVSVNSVKTYVRQIYQKIGVSRRAQAVAWGLAHGF
jgi:DNA-binding NarL/FixJ family response regulator